MSHEVVLATLLNSKEEAKPTKYISEYIGLATSKHTIGSEPKGGLLDH